MFQNATTDVQNSQVDEVQMMETVRANTSNSMYFTRRSTKHGKHNKSGRSKSGNRPGTAVFKRPHIAKGPFICESCLKKFMQNRDLIFHRRLHLHSSSIHCCNCLRQFRMNLQKNIHEKGCNARRYECYLCGLLKGGKSRLKDHMFKHTGMKAYPCSKCGRMFAYKSSQTVHEKYYCRKN